jgi:hypothetical protein
MFHLAYRHSLLGGVMVSALDIGPKGHRFKPIKGDGFLRAIKIHSTPSFTGEVKPKATCIKFLQYVKEPCVVY